MEYLVFAFTLVTGGIIFALGFWTGHRDSTAEWELIERLRAGGANVMLASHDLDNTGEIVLQVEAPWGTFSYEAATLYVCLSQALKTMEE